MPSSNGNVEITTGQRMVSATIGSVLTSLLGMSEEQNPAILFSNTDCARSYAAGCCPRSITIPGHSDSDKPLALSRLLNKFQTTSARLGSQLVLPRSILCGEQWTVLLSWEWVVTGIFRSRWGMCG